MIRFARQFALNLMAVILAMALVGLGFGHRMVLQNPPDLSAYAMPDGTLPELCLDGGSADHGQKKQPPCPLCRIVDAVEISGITLLPVAQLTPVVVVWPQQSLAAAPPPLARAPPARGPPAFLI